MLSKPVADAILNIFSTLIPLAFLQLIVLPAMSSETSEGAYGIIVTMLSVLNLFPGTLGNTLNNVRLVYRSKYESWEEIGSFQIIFTIFASISIACVLCSVVMYGYATPASCLLMSLIAICWVAREYYCVEFRLTLNYRKVLLCNIWLSLGYGLGYILFRLTGAWEYVYLVGQAAGLSYILKNTCLHKEPLKVEPELKQIGLEAAELSISGLLSRGLTYADRLMLYPILGGGAVTVYYVASLAGKLISTAIGPINSVVLSYLARRNQKPISAFCRSMLLCTILCLIAYFVIKFAAPFVLNLLYPEYAADALQYVGIASLAALVYVLISVASPFTLRYYAMKWQMLINATSLALYVFMGFGLASAYGLMGFCLSTLVSNFVKLMMLVGLFLFVESDTKVKAASLV